MTVAGRIRGLRRVATLVLSLAVSNAFALDGRALFLDAKKGNCAACHRAPNDTSLTIASTVGPPLQNIAARYSRVELKALIQDLSQTSPALRDTIMPPYGRHRILDEAEIDSIINYVIQL